MTKEELRTLAMTHVAKLTNDLLHAEHYHYSHQDVYRAFEAGFLEAVVLLDQHCRASENADCDGRSGGRDDLLGASFNSGLSTAQEPFDELLWSITP